MPGAQGILVALRLPGLRLLGSWRTCEASRPVAIEATVRLDEAVGERSE